jgi:LysM repeat protein
VQLLSPAVNLNPNPSVGGGDITVVGASALMPQEGPSGTAADIENRPASSQISVYTVQPHDTLGVIAKMFGVDTKTILGANDIPGGMIHPGETLIILPIIGIQHTVVAGETLAGLAKKYSSNAHDIAQYNGLADGAALAMGDSIIIPNAELAAAPTAPAAPKRSTKVSREPFLGGSGPALGGYFSWPVDGGIITQGLHGWNAVDIGAPRGTGIFAAAAGTVIVARANGGWNGGYGNYVVISHDNGTQTLYGHMSKVLVSAGEQVNQGDVIGKVGTTGESTGPHLHFEVRGAANPFADLSLGSSQ